jgi:hypothetical protein
MSWLELGDVERLCRYANEICRDSQTSDLFRISEEESHFTDILKRRCNDTPDLMRYEPHTIRGLRDKLNLLWKNSALPQKDVLINIVAAATLKNEPDPLDYERRLYEWNLAIEHDNALPVMHTKNIQTAAYSQESIAAREAAKEDPLTSVLIYEF